jgi:hypothetical protein
MGEEHEELFDLLSAMSAFKIELKSWVKAKAVPLHDTQALGGRGNIARTHSRPRH